MTSISLPVVYSNRGQVAMAYVIFFSEDFLKSLDFVESTSIRSSYGPDAPCKYILCSFELSFLLNQKLLSYIHYSSKWYNSRLFSGSPLDYPRPPSHPSPQLVNMLYRLQGALQNEIFWVWINSEYRRKSKYLCVTSCLP